MNEYINTRVDLSEDETMPEPVAVADFD